MNRKRITIYDLAKELGISASYISKALNNHPLISEKVKKRVKAKAAELNYRHNSHAANLRQGSSKTIGVIVPQINQGFFSDAIAGIEEVCFKHNHSLVICQSHDTFKQECMAIDTLIQQNVDCILISVSAETQSGTHLETIADNNIALVQFDRCIDKINSHKVLNDNKDAAYRAVKQLVTAGYKRIAFLGGPKQLSIYKHRKDGYLKAINEARLTIPQKFIIDDVLGKQPAAEVAATLLDSTRPPDAFFTVSDHQCLGILEVAEARNLRVPEQLGLFGFANEGFSELIKPALSSIDQQSNEMGRHAANVYFTKILNAKETSGSASKTEIIKSNIIVRQSSLKPAGK